MIKMKRMNHIFRSLSLLPVLAAALTVSCSKVSTEETNAAIKRQFDAWRAIYYPDAVEENGIYVIEETPGTGLEWSKNLPVTFVTYTIRSLNGTVTDNSDEQWAKQLGTWDQTYYYGPQILLTGEGTSYAGIDALMEAMKEGGSRTAIIPSWMFTKERYATADEYLKHEIDASATSGIYTITFMGQTENLAKYEFDNLRRYSIENWDVADTLSTAAVFFKSHTVFPGEPKTVDPDCYTIAAERQTASAVKDLVQFPESAAVTRPEPDHEKNADNQDNQKGKTNLFGQETKDGKYDQHSE